ncbi:hypothetical protein BJX63DRAFT_267193 [Aspergillus granulosus]|uniref:Secreted protein n=1 Tax=Aspergillus granulosus TaxID=176169 RepID=A0ABR4HAE9_9EURO
MRFCETRFSPHCMRLIVALVFEGGAVEARDCWSLRLELAMLLPEKILQHREVDLSFSGTLGWSWSRDVPLAAWLMTRELFLSMVIQQ